MAKSTTLDRLYTGEGGIEFVGRRRLWYAITIGLLVISVLGVIFRGFDLGIDFEGGTKMNMPAAELSTDEVSDTFADATGVSPELVQIVGSGDGRILEINSERLTEDQIDAARSALYETYQPEDLDGNVTPDAIGDSTVSESWGSTITSKMIQSMIVFLIAVFIYIAIRFERAMATAALAAILVDFVVIAGIYAIFGLEVSPATIIGLLTVLAFSLYDTVVVFDKVRENTRDYRKQDTYTHAELANSAVNQTVMRSISTTVISALPIIALLIVAVGLMGVGTLKDLAVVQLIGVVEGTFSSVFLATPILVDLEQRRKVNKEHTRRVKKLRAGEDPTVLETDAEVAEDSVSAVRVATPEIPKNTHATWRPDRHNN
ncbi:MAG: protein translocase subunit SecF [Corynebacterium sp.]|nr:protein translocase subunit SecF [Corynebacterium sp.]